MHEVALAVSLVNEAAFYPACSAIFESQTEVRGVLVRVKVGVKVGVRVRAVFEAQTGVQCAGACRMRAVCSPHPSPQPCP